MCLKTWPKIQNFVIHLPFIKKNCYLPSFGALVQACQEAGGIISHGLICHVRQQFVVPCDLGVHAWALVKVARCWTPFLQWLDLQCTKNHSFEEIVINVQRTTCFKIPWFMPTAEFCKYMYIRCLITKKFQKAHRSEFKAFWNMYFPFSNNTYYINIMTLISYSRTIL